MLLERPIKKGSIITVKLNSGEELVARFETEDDDSSNRSLRIMFVADDSSNLHDDSAYINEVVYGANVDQASWRFGREVSTSEQRETLPNQTALRYIHDHDHDAALFC